MANRFAWSAVMGLLLAASLHCASASEVYFDPGAGEGPQPGWTSGINDSLYIYATGNPVAYENETLELDITGNGSVIVGKSELGATPTARLDLSIGAVVLTGPNTSLIVGGSDANVFSVTALKVNAGGKIVLETGNTLNAGALTLGNGSKFEGAGKVNAASLTVSTLSHFTDAENVATIVSGSTILKNTAEYYVAGTNNIYRGDITVEAGAIFADRDDGGYSAGATITVGEAGKDTLLTLAGGSLSTQNSLVVNKAQNAGTHTVFIKDGNIMLSTIDAMGGLLDLSGSKIRVHVDTPDREVVIFSGGGIKALDYTQLNGTVVNKTLPNSDKMVTSGSGAVGGLADSAAVYVTTGDDTQFIGGLTVASNGVIRSDDGSGGSQGIVTLGEADQNTPTDGRLSLIGSATLDGESKAALSFVDAAGNGKGVLAVSGKNNHAFGDVIANGFHASIEEEAEFTVAGTDSSTAGNSHGLQVQSMTVHGVLVLGHDGAGTDGMLNAAAGGSVETQEGFAVASTGVLQARHGDSSLYNRGASGDLEVDRGGLISAAGANIHASGYGRTVIDGTYEAGYANGAVTKLTTDSDVTVGKNGVVSITDDLALNASVDDVILATTNGTLVNNANTSVASIFGQYGFAVKDNGAGQDMYISSISNRVAGDGSEADRALAYRNVRSLWGGKQIDTDLGGIIYDASVNPSLIESNPSGSEVGQKNLDLFEAIGNPSGRNVGRNTVEFVNGARYYGPTDIAIETSRAFASDVNLRTKAIRCQFVAQREAGSMDALATMGMNSDLINRFWAGGFGYWLDADDKDSFSGYKYDGYGLILGYDRVVAPGLAMGVSAAYMDGDYEDKGAIANNSKIESFTAGLYATYCSDYGWFATGNLAYTYSDNRLSDLRNDPTTADNSNSWAESNYHTTTWNLGLSGGYDFRPSESFTITPQIGINYLRAANSDHNAVFGGLATQRARGLKNDGLFLPVDLTVMYDMHLPNDAKLRFEASAAYAYNLRDNGLSGRIDYFDLIDQNANTPSAKVASRDNSRHNYKFGAAVHYQLTQWDFSLKYDYIARPDSTTHRLLGTACLAF